MCSEQWDPFRICCMVEGEINPYSSSFVSCFLFHILFSSVIRPYC